MSSKWQPDDSLAERDEKGASKGSKRIAAALRKHKVSSAKRVTTSRDEGMKDVNKTLKRPRSSMPPGVEHWQVPVTLGQRKDVLVFKSRMKPGAKVPTHAHKHDVFRVVVSGSVKYEGKTLKAGDWMHVPAGQSYAMQAGPTGASIYYHH